MSVLLYRLSASLFNGCCPLIFPFLFISIILFAIKIFKMSSHIWLFSFFSTTSKLHPNLLSSFCETLKSSVFCAGNGLNNWCKLTAASALIALAFKYLFPDFFFPKCWFMFFFKLLPKWSFLCTDLILYFKHTSWSFKHWSLSNHSSPLYTTFPDDPTN